MSCLESLSQLFPPNEKLRGLLFARLKNFDRNKRDGLKHE